MARPSTITDEQILEAARAVFLEQGVTATTAEVARRAGVAEGTLFKRFGNKAELFRAAMQVELNDPEWLRTLIGAREGEDPRQVLQRVGEQAVAFFRQLVPLMMMHWSSGKQFRLPDHLQGPNAAPLRALAALGAFVEREMAAGRMRHHSPEVVARMFLGSIQSYVFFELLLRAQRRMAVPVEEYLRELIDIIWTGVSPVTPKKGT